ncbi:MAG TPA: prepilin-type N-terminal cleavage/methylation domain-containing protein [Pyrinomonadaceae bacterium]|jgi:prepilin-type N-terminal cleavage/methylation domain-containing protein
MRKIESDLQKGFSLLELIVVITIVAIVSVMAITQFGRTETRLQRQNIARELKVYLERARFDSVKRRASNPADMARVTITNATAFNVTTDMNVNGTIDSADTRFMSLNGRTDARITGNNLIFPIVILFDHRGQATAIDDNGNGAVINPTFTICDANCTFASANANNSTVITITPTGTVAMLNGGSTIATVNAPNVSTINGGGNVSNLVYVNSNGY